MSRDVKQLFILWLHRWLVRFCLLKRPGRGYNNDEERFQISQTMTIDDPGVITVTDATAATMFDPTEVVLITANQATIRKPRELILKGIIGLTIKEPAEVVIEDPSLVMIKESEEGPEADESITFPYPETVTIHGAGTLTLTVHGNDDSYRVSANPICI